MAAQRSGTRRNCTAPVIQEFNSNYSQRMIVLLAKVRLIELTDEVRASARGFLITTGFSETSGRDRSSVSRCLCLARAAINEVAYETHGQKLQPPELAGAERDDDRSIRECK